MRFEIESAKPIKPMVVRFSVLMWEEDSLVGEYEIAVDIDPYVDYQLEENNTNININAAGVQQYLTTQIAEMQITGLIAKGFNGLEWDANEEEVEDESEVGEITKLQPVLPEGK